MTKASDTKEVGRSVRARLHNRARATGEDFQLVWTGFQRKTGARDIENLADAVNEVAAFLEGPMRAAAERSQFDLRWHAGGPAWVAGSTSP